MKMIMFVFVGVFVLVVGKVGVDLMLFNGFCDCVLLVLVKVDVYGKVICVFLVVEFILCFDCLLC